MTDDKMWVVIISIIIILWMLYYYRNSTTNEMCAACNPDRENFYGYVYYGNNDNKPLFWGKWFNKNFWRNDQELNNRLIDLYR